jgi:predicted phage terminase large subunit-like protein
MAANDFRDDQLNAASRFIHTLTPKWTKYMVPPLFRGRRTINVKQHLFLLLDRALEVMYGGAGGGGKTIALLLLSLQYADVPGHSALILRRTFKELSKSGAIMDRAHEMLRGTSAIWSGQEKCYYFPTGHGLKPSRLQFGYLESERDKYQYSSAEFQDIIFEELTEFEESQYTFLFSRLRKPADMDCPLRMRSATNPGGVGHEWVKARFPVDREPLEKEPLFIPAAINDNFAIDREAYIASLMNLLPIDRERIMKGNWTVTDGGRVIDRSWFAEKFIDAVPPGILVRCRAWDLAASSNRENKRTAGVKMARTVDDSYIVEHAVAEWWVPGDRDNAIKATAEADTPRCKVLIEEEGGSGGPTQNQALIKRLAGWDAESIKVTGGDGDKIKRAGPFASQCKIGNVYLVRGPWNESYLNELHVAQEKARLLDQLDASSLGFNWLAAFSGAGTAEEGTLPSCECRSNPHKPWCESRMEEHEHPSGGASEFRRSIGIRRT